MRCDALCMVRVFRVRLLLFSSAMRLSVALVGVVLVFVLNEAHLCVCVSAVFVRGECAVVDAALSLSFGWVGWDWVRGECT